MTYKYVFSLDSNGYLTTTISQKTKSSILILIDSYNSTACLKNCNSIFISYEPYYLNKDIPYYLSDNKHLYNDFMNKDHNINYRASIFIKNQILKNMIEQTEKDSTVYCTQCGKPLYNCTCSEDAE